MIARCLYRRRLDEAVQALYDAHFARKLSLRLDCEMSDVFCYFDRS